MKILRKFIAWIGSFFIKEKIPILSNPVDGIISTPNINNGRLLNVTVNTSIDFTYQEKEFLIKVINLKKEVINSIEFRNKFLALKCSGTNGMTMLQIYQKLLSGKDSFEHQVDRDINLFLKMYYMPNRTIAYTYGTTHQIWINRYHYQRRMKEKNGIAIQANTFLHEYMHKLGFNDLDRNSVPYQSGQCLEFIAKLKIGGIILTPTPG